jgi:hypothetical protein
MDELRRQRHDAFRAAERHALERLARNKSARTSTLIMDSYRRRLAELWDADLPAVQHAYELSELVDDPVGMQAAAVVALRKRGPLPNDPASALVTRFVHYTHPDGSGGWRYEFPDALGAWEDLQALEQWERSDHLAADATFSVAATPERPDDPNPPDPHDVARDDVAQLYTPGGNGGRPAAAP